MNIIMKDYISALAAIVVAAVTILFTFRIKKLESTLEKVKGVRTHETEMMIESYRLIWKLLIELETIIDDEFIIQIKLLLNNREPIRLKRIIETSNKIRAEMIFLPDELFSKTEQLVKELTNNVDAYIDKVGEIYVAGELSKEELYKQQLQTIHTKTISEYANGIENLRKLFRSSIENTMLR